MYDRSCPDCNTQLIDCWEPITVPEVLCKCGKPTVRVWLTKPAAVIGDDIPGGVWIHHGLCDPVTGEPRKYYSKSEMAAEAKRRGILNNVRHVGGKGSDKSEHTTRWY